MKKITVVVAVLVLISAVALLSVFSGCSPDENGKLKVVTTTSLLECIVEEVGGDLVDVVNIIPPAQCPGHFDVTPQDMQKLADADIFFLHGWQGEKFTQDLIDSADNPDLTVITAGVAGNWMVPAVHSAAVDEVEAALSQADSANSDSYAAAAEAYKDSIEAKAIEAQARLAPANLGDVRVLCAEKLSGMVAWTGLSVVATYPDPDSMTPALVADLVDQGIENDVTLIVDNLQSGQDAGAGIAEELDCQRIVLTNFPGGFEDTETWAKALDWDIDVILAAVSS